MKSDEIFFTKTMAQVHAEQGNLTKAAEIYRYLLKKEPERQDLIEALEGIEKRRLGEASEGLKTLFGTWIDLLLIYGRLQKLKHLRGKQNESTS